MSRQSKQKNKNNPKFKIRSLTISKLHIASRSKCFYKPQIPPVPIIRLSGKWLKEIGFESGEKVQVIVSKNLLVIIPEKEFSD